MKKKLLLSFFTLLTPLILLAQEAEKGLDERINEAVEPIATTIANIVFFAIPLGGGNSIPIVLIVLIVGATYFTIYFGFPNFRLFGLATSVVRGKYDNVAGDPSEDPESTLEEVGDPDLITRDGDIRVTARTEGHYGEVTAFQALTAALSATVGLGNIAGVAIAIAIGGPGATFWMILAGLIGMASKFTECTLGVKYREIGPDGTVYGGPMYYLKKGLAEKGLVKLGKIFAVFYAVMLIGGSFGGGNVFQANQAAAQFTSLIGSDSGFAGTAFGVIIAILVGIVIIGGIKRIGKVAERIVPFMVGIYVLAAIFILLANFSNIPAAFGQIFEGALTGKGIIGGFVGVLIQGFRRAAFSNEAGVGSASVAHSAVRTRYPASEGVVALLEPFIDTVVVCTMTALVIIMFNMDGHFQYGASGNNEVAIKGESFAYISSNSGEIPNNIVNQDAMNQVLGSGNWDDLRYKTLNIETLLAKRDFVFMEGSGNHAKEMESFLNIHIDKLENWVKKGGNLFINASLAKEGKMNLGFDSTFLVYNPSTTFINNAIASDTKNPVFNGPFLPVDSAWSGNPFSHATINGKNLTPLVQDASDTTRFALAFKTWGKGKVFFAGMPANNFHSSNIAIKNLWFNTLDYLSLVSLGGVTLTSAAFDAVLPGFSLVLTLAVILFAFSTMLSWSYYGLQAWKFLFGRGKTIDMAYKILFCVFVVIGAAASLGAVIDFSDAMVFAMIFPNMIGLVILAPKVRVEIRKYLAAIKSGSLNK